MTREYIQVFTTVGKKQDAENMAELLVERKLAGCIQVVGPVLSTYWWEGKIVKDKEWLCIVKSKKVLYKKLEEAIKKIHPYELPEITVTPITAGSAGYLRWLNSVLRNS